MAFKDGEWAGETGLDAEDPALIFRADSLHDDRNSTMKIEMEDL